MPQQEKTMPLLMAVLLAFLLGSAGSARALDFGSDPDALRDSVAARGSAIAEAWFILPTGRYDHFVHDNSAEAGGLRARLADGRIVSMVLPSTEVFEDSIVRLADLDSDGTEEIIAVMSSGSQGAALAVIGVDGDSLGTIAATPFIGQPHRWLNPAQIADFDGDGRLEIALVQMPHLVKRLELWRLEGGRLRRVAQVDDVSNHAIGTEQQSLSLARDFDGDGVPDLVIPSGGREALRVFSFAGGRVTELVQLALDGAAVGDLTYEGTFSVRLADGRTQRVAIP
jgi:hypothetical protein